MFEIRIQALLGTEALRRLDQRPLGFFGDFGFHVVEFSGAYLLTSPNAPVVVHAVP